MAGRRLRRLGLPLALVGCLPFAAPAGCIATAAPNRVHSERSPDLSLAWKVPVSLGGFVCVVASTLVFDLLAMVFSQELFPLTRAALQEMLKEPSKHPHLHRHAADAPWHSHQHGHRTALFSVDDHAHSGEVRPGPAGRLAKRRRRAR